MDFEYTRTLGAADLDLQFSVKEGRFQAVRRPAVPRDGVLIGVFAGPASDAAIAKLDGLTPSALPPAQPVRPGMPVTQVLLRAPRQVRLSASEPNGLQALNGLTKEVERITHELPAVRAIGLQCLGLAGPNLVRVRLSNPGSQPVALDWTSPIVSVAGYREGGSAETISTGDPVKLPASVPSRGQVDIEVPVSFPEKGTWMIRAIYRVRGVGGADSDRVGGATASPWIHATLR